MNKAYAFALITVTDPETHLSVEVQMYRHENGGIFGIDASFLTNGGMYQLADPEDEDSDAIIPDPFVDATDLEYDSFKVQLQEVPPT